MNRVAVLDDWQEVAHTQADWSQLAGLAEIEFFTEPFADENDAVRSLVDFDILLAMRERTPFPASLIERLPKLRLFCLTGMRAGAIDIAALKARGVTVCGTGGGESGAATAELALALVLAAARHIPAADTATRLGQFQKEVDPGFELDGRTLGLLGLGRIGTRMARYGIALGMKVIAWSPNLTPDRAALAGVEAVGKDTLFSCADVVSLHLVLSDRTRGTVGARELGLMKPGALLVNTSRADLVDPDALVTAATAGRISAALDVHHTEPLRASDPLILAPNTVLTPHIGYGVTDIYREFYRQSIENVLAFLRGRPARTL